MKKQLILGCPWCGMVPHIVKNFLALGDPIYTIECIGGCCFNPRAHFGTRQQAIKAWNTRRRSD